MESKLVAVVIIGVMLTIMAGAIFAPSARFVPPEAAISNCLSHGGFPKFSQQGNISTFECTPPAVPQVKPVLPTTTDTK